MAPPTNRRPGYSRRAQYSLFVAYVVAIGGALFAALLLVISVADPSGFSALRLAGAEITAPVARFFDSARRTVNGLGGNMSAYFDAASKNAAMKRELEAKRTKLIEAGALKLENNRLRAMVQLIEETPEKVAAGRLISSTASSVRRYATLSIGSNHGVLRAQPVRAPEGLIGRIVEVGPNTARVLLITDADNVVPVMRLSDGLSAFASGTSNGLVAIKPISIGVNHFKKGDIIVTSGNGGLYPPDIPFAVVLAKTSDGAIARPYADPSHSPYALVMKAYFEAARNEQQKATPDGSAPTSDD